MSRRPGSEPLEQPDFLIAGCTLPSGKVWLVGSRHLTDAELRAEYPPPVYDVREGLIRPWADYTVTAHLQQFTLVEAPDYRTALQRLTEAWAEQDARDGRPPRISGLPQLGAPDGQ
jgi:hypothetical protein